MCYILAIVGKAVPYLSLWKNRHCLALTCSLGPIAMSRILSLRLIHAMHALTSSQENWKSFAAFFFTVTNNTNLPDACSFFLCIILLLKFCYHILP